MTKLRNPDTLIIQELRTSSRVPGDLYDRAANEIVLSYRWYEELKCKQKRKEAE